MYFSLTALRFQNLLTVLYSEKKNKQVLFRTVMKVYDMHLSLLEQQERNKTKKQEQGKKGRVNMESKFW